VSRKRLCLLAFFLSAYAWFFYMAKTYVAQRWPYISGDLDLSLTAWGLRIAALLPLALIFYGIWSNDRMEKRIDNRAKNKERNLL
jgi:hypothetical protein